MAEPLKSDLTYTGHDQQALHALLVNMKDLANALQVQAAAHKADVTTIKAQVNALVADMATRISNHNTLRTKLNSDAGVTDADYAAAGAITAVTTGVATMATITASALSLLKT